MNDNNMTVTPHRVSNLSKGIHETLRKLSKIFHGLGNNLTDCLMYTSQTGFFNALKPEVNHPPYQYLIILQWLGSALILLVVDR